MDSPRNCSVDLLKLLAAFGVVIVHLAPSTVAAEAFTSLFLSFAVPFFLLISLHFFIDRAKTVQSLKLSDLRLQRLLVPYGVWTLIYCAIRLVKSRLVGKPFDGDEIGIVFFGAVAVQLYFIPLLLLFQAEALAVILLLREPKQRFIGFGIALGAGIFGYVGSTRGYLGFDGVFASGAMYVALAFLFGSLQVMPIGRRINVVFGWLIAIFLVLSVWRGYPLYWLGFAQGPIIGYGMSAVALNWRFSPSNSALRLLLTCSYGIYLAHFGILEGLEFAMTQAGLELTPYSVIEKVLLGGLISLLCVLFAVVARMHWLSAYLLLGESSGRIRNGGTKTSIDSALSLPTGQNQKVMPSRSIRHGSPGCLVL